MKHILLILALTVSVFGQPIKSPGVNGENIVNPAFRNAVLPSQGSANGKYLKSNGTAASWETVTAAPSGTGFAKVTSGVWDTPSATIPHTDITGLGTAATTAATAYATAAQGMAATGGPLRVACVGTSITALASNLVTDGVPRITDSTAGYGGWLEHLSNHRVRLVRKSGTAETSTDKCFGYSGFKLPGITDGTSGVFPLDNAIASGAEVLVLEGGINDVILDTVSSTTLVSRITSYWTKAAASGKKVIALNVTPWGGEYVTAGNFVVGHTYEIVVPTGTTWTGIGAADNLTGTRFVATGVGSGTGAALSKTAAAGITTRDTISTANAQLSAIASGLGITLIDTHSVATLVDGFASVETLWDRLHPTPAYAHRIAALIDAQLASSYANRPQEMIVPAGASGVWITSNNSPTSATLPSGWSETGTWTKTYSSRTDSDGTTWQRVRFLQGGADRSYNELYIRATTGFSAGDKVRFSCRLRSVSGTFVCNEIDVNARSTADYSTWRYFAAITGGSNLGTGDFDPITGLFVSPVFTIPASTVALDAKLGFYNTDVTVDVRQFGIFKVIENQ